MEDLSSGLGDRCRYHAQSSLSTPPPQPSKQDRMKLKSSAEILNEATRTIAHLHRRPTMYAGSRTKSGAADSLGVALWMAHSFWASCQSPPPNLNETRNNVARSRDRECAANGFAYAYRYRNPSAAESDVFDYVLECWREIGDILGVNHSEDLESEN